MIKKFAKLNIATGLLLVAFIAALFFCDGLHKSHHGMHHQESQNQQQDSHGSMIVAIQPNTEGLSVKLKVDSFTTGAKHLEQLIEIGFLLLSIIFLLWQILGKLRNYLSWWRSLGLLNPKIYPVLYIA